MKKVVLSMFLFLVGCLCEAKITVTISGKITNLATGEVMLSGAFGPDIIKVKPDGSFSQKLELDYAGKYYFGAGDNATFLYLRDKSNLVISADAKNFFKTVKFSGTDASENAYLAKKEEITNAMDFKAFYSSDEKSYLNQIAKLKADMTAALAKSKPAKTFSELEARDLYYMEQSFLWNYPSYHPGITKKENFVLATDFPKPEKDKINFNNGTDYAFSMSFREMTSRWVSENLPKDSADKYPVFEAVKQFDSPLMRDAILSGLQYNINAGNPDSKELYDRLTAVVTSEKAKKDFDLKLAAIERTKAGNASPTFDYENVGGTKTSLESLRGKYVYIDVWATWCGPCREEIPHLQKMEMAYHGKKIEFVSISADKQKDREKWKKMIAEKQMGGLQLLTDKDFDSEFIKAYAIDGIPRFILIDPSGKIVNADAPRPSDPELAKLLDSLPL
ncbi:TlpA disulfide reductase family protein [Flavobacterium sp.]|uniref:TlpA disulfide reductase family protein n=1 Tax=Flavobacterium sp. TaxID=239 RepID=UPI0025B7E4E9|nr:TlpA disulfide reductase family protein [Flavobacterium sp.]